MDRIVSLCSSSDLQASSKTVICVSHTLRRPELPTCARAYAAAPAGCFVVDVSLLCLEGVPYAPSEGMPKTPPSPSPSSAAAAQTFTFPHRRPSPISTHASGGYGRRLLPCPPRFHAARASMRDLLLFIVVRFHFNPIKVLSGKQSTQYVYTAISF